MEKAARVVRRSSVKLMSLGGGHTDLHVLLSEVKDMRQAAKAFMNAQNAVSQDLLKWAANEENRALQDVANQLAELNLLWTEVQREFGEHLKDYRHMFEMVLEGEKHVSQSRNQFAMCEQREIKIRKELKKAFKKSSSAEIQSLEGRLAQAERAKHLAQLEVTDRVRENEAVKLIRLKEGLTKMSQAYSDFARKCSVVFDAQQDIVQELPDVLDQDLEDLKYTGTGVTRHRVQQAKEKVRNYRVRKEYCQIPHKYSEPPPPYSFTNDFVDPVSPSILSPPLRPSTSPRRRISTAVTDNLESSSKQLQQHQHHHHQQQQQQQRCSNNNCDNDNGTISSGSSQHFHPHHQYHPHPHLPPPQHPNDSPMYPSLPSYKTTCSSSSNTVVVVSTSAIINTSSSPSMTEASTKTVSTTSPTPPRPPPPPHPSSMYSHHHHPPPSPFPSLGSSIPPPPLPPHETGPPHPPEVPADLRTVVISPSSLYHDDHDDDDDNGDDIVDNGVNVNANVVSKERERKGILGGELFHRGNSIQETAIGMVDFDPAWDDSYEENLSGAMGGAKI